MQARILWVEGSRTEGNNFIDDLQKKGYNLLVVPTGNAALEKLDDYDPDLVVVHASSMRSSGKRICRSLRAKSDGLPILVIVNSSHANEDLCANTVLTLPFTSRKLLNRIKPLLPAEGKKLIHKGPIRLDLEMRKVRCQGREQKLTPRLTEILKILLQNAGTVVEREDLFRQVWKTEYTEDTRTLDVHINWLRKAIEENPKEPYFIKTIRGVGYRLDV